MRAIILAGGRGVRLHPYTKVVPKPLIPLGDMPILQIILMQLRRAKFSSVTLSVCYKAPMIKRFVADGKWLGLEVNYSHDHETLGTAGPLAHVLQFDEPALVMNSDLLTDLNFKDVFLTHQRSGAIATVVVCRKRIEVGLGVIELDQNQKIVGYREKPPIDLLVSGGIYILDPAVVGYIQRGMYMDMPTLFQRLLTDGHEINSYLFDGRWFDIGTPHQYQHAEEEFQKHWHHYLPPDDIGGEAADERPAHISSSMTGWALPAAAQTITLD